MDASQCRHGTKVELRELPRLIYAVDANPQHILSRVDEGRAVIDILERMQCRIAVAVERREVAVAPRHPVLRNAQLRIIDAADVVVEVGQERVAVDVDQMDAHRFALFEIARHVVWRRLHCPPSRFLRRSSWHK